MVGQLFRKDGIKKVRRGLAGRVDSGLSAGGPSYGFQEQLELLAAIEAYVEEYMADRKRLAAEAVRNRASIERRTAKVDDERRRARRLGEIDRSVNNLLSLAENGADPATIGPRLRDLEAERTALRRQASESGEDVVTLHPSLAQHYRALVVELRENLVRQDFDGKAEVLAKVRALIDRIIIYPKDEPNGRDIELVGQLAALTGPAGKRRFSMGLLVAEEGLEPPTRGL